MGNIKDEKNCLLQLNSIIKEENDLYRNAAKSLGLSESRFWILYSLKEAKDAMTQKEICYALCQPKQTVNSALKKMESEGYIELFYAGDRRCKLIRLTREGMKLAEKTVDRVVALELRALEELGEEEVEMFLSLLRRHTDILKKNFSYLNGEQKNE